MSVKNKTHKKILNHLNNRKILDIFNRFSVSLNTLDNVAVAVSGGPDSLSLAFLTKCFELKNKMKVKYFIVDHKLRKESSKEAKIVKNILKKANINSSIITWNGKKPVKNIQSLARDKRYFLLAKECKKNNINNILLGHHLDDLSENFLIRLVRGSGLNGLISFNKKTKYKNQNLNILRPLLDIKKKDLIYISKKVFNSFIKDPTNENANFKRTRIRNLLETLEE
ncbi:tRNA lysidine(34) synthetase TilS, partial [Candidatus Pelagibacter bacterium]|nr:tRNA lysidine(34) synthetase TilS [Candidatus Pelagibacter bacterium]